MLLWNTQVKHIQIVKFFNDTLQNKSSYLFNTVLLFCTLSQILKLRLKSETAERRSMFQLFSRIILKLDFGQIVIQKKIVHKSNQAVQANDPKRKFIRDS